MILSVLVTLAFVATLLWMVVRAFTGPIHQRHRRPVHGLARSSRWSALGPQHVENPSASAGLAGWRRGRVGSGWIVLGGELAVPCTRNPLERG
jgi:hypothetical protein